MKILILNPNSDQTMAESIGRTAVRFAGNRFRVDCRASPGAPEFIETYENMARAALPMISIISESRGDYDAVIIACHYDPNLDAAKEISSKPVIGIGEASMKIASMLGHRFSIITTDNHSIPIHKELARKYGMEAALASVRAPDPGIKDNSDFDRYLHTSQQAVAEDMAEVIVLGCAGLGGLDSQLQKHLEIPVLDGVICALIIGEGLVKYGVSISKAGRFNASGK